MSNQFKKRNMIIAVFLLSLFFQSAFSFAKEVNWGRLCIEDRFPSFAPKVGEFIILADLDVIKFGAVVSAYRESMDTTCFYIESVRSVVARKSPSILTPNLLEKSVENYIQSFARTGN